MRGDLSAERGHHYREQRRRRLRPLSSLRDSCLCLLVLLVAVLVIAAVLTLVFFVLRETNLVDQCTVSRLRFCDGRLPYRTTSLPNFAGASSDQELVDNLVFFEAISESGCSPLAAEYVCAAMEPQCVSRPTPHVLPPCRHFCQASDAGGRRAGGDSASPVTGAIEAAAA
ncbi:Frizzled-4 [Amphibalanus amphitrite]|uniref:Frizzled-4 n=1 Tax=Amphibalanus amphitrite TaxID=1232801 RepID=A0A6A4VAQ7_AMPAM|nr:Frizzled-4 [Amphibalanus amphitrite]